MLQRVAVCYSVLQCVVRLLGDNGDAPGYCLVLHFVAVCCSVLQCVAACCSVSQCVAVR